MGQNMCCCGRRPAKFNESYANYPRQYVARRGCPGEINGDIFKPAWEMAPWSEPFVEIRGDKDAPEGTSPTRYQETRMKMLWDDEFLYIAAIMDVAAGDELVAKFTERNSPIFHTDSDFEVFVDWIGSCHNYRELEMNALNTVWNLMLNRPYMDGGGEISGRVAKAGESNFWDVKHQKTAARVIQGALHDASNPAKWCCEIALAFTDTFNGPDIATAQEWTKPTVGGFARINFSRVEKKGAVNWVWTPQIVWSPTEGCYQGQVNMHLPDAWGYVVFSDEIGQFNDGSVAALWEDPSFPARHAAYCVYYAVRAFSQKEGWQAQSIDELRASGLLCGAALADCDIDFHCDIDSSGKATEGFEVVCTSDNGWRVRVRHDRHTTTQFHGPLGKDPDNGTGDVNAYLRKKGLPIRSMDFMRQQSPRAPLLKSEGSAAPRDVFCH